MGLISIGNIRQGIENPSLAVGAIRMICMRVNRWYFDRQARDGTTVIEEDWDTLFILDGCRYDAFSRQCSFDGRLSSRQSWGADSKEFIARNFTGRELQNTIYVSANPFLSEIPEGTFFRVRNLLNEAWNDDLGTVSPDDSVKIALDERESYPDKRMIVHLMQPPFPFIGETGQQFDQGTLSRSGQTSSANPIWTDLAFGHQQISREKLMRAYRENLDLAFEAVGEYVDAVDEKIVLTADHGNLIGEHVRPIPARWYGHPPGIYVDDLIKIPWFVINADDRPNITSDELMSAEEMEDGTLSDRPEALGYR